MRGTLAGAICNIGNFTLSVGQAANAKPHNLRLRQKQVIVLDIAMLIDMNADAYVHAADD